MSELWTERVVFLHVIVFIAIILDALSRRKVRVMPSLGTVFLWRNGRLGPRPLHG
jgi:hypothetical protein